MNWKVSLWLIVTAITSASTQVIVAENSIHLIFSPTTTRPEQDEFQLNNTLNNGEESSIVDDYYSDNNDTDGNINPDDENNGNYTNNIDDNNSTNNVINATEPYEPDVTEASTTDGTVMTNANVEELTESSTYDNENTPDDGEVINDLVIQTGSGLVRGFEWRGSNEILAYLDVPYGKFNSIFEPPTEPDSWQVIHEAQAHNTRCPQLDGDIYVGETSCLTLSIFTPREPVNTSVLFFIHESDFFIKGSGDPAIYGPEYLVPKNIILVLPNYRLGPLGFLCLRNSSVPGNAGLKDLALALEWTKNNIEAFGGDPSNIAVSGDGTSAALAGYLALSPISRDLITKVITDSGSVLSDWAIDRNPMATAERVTDAITQNTSEAGQLGQNVFESVTLETLLLSAKDIHLRPCIEQEGFLTDAPWNILTNLETNISYLIGSANHAGLLEALAYNEDTLISITDNFATVLPNDLVFANNDEKRSVGEKFRRQYFENMSITVENLQNLSLFHTDASFVGPCVRAGHALVDAGATVFLYEFSFVGMLNKELVSIPNAPTFGAVRGDIAGYLFALDGHVPLVGTAERRVVDLVTDLWASFIQTSQPISNDVTWQSMSASNSAEYWLAIGAEVSAESGFHTERLRLWGEVYHDHFIDNNAAFRLSLPTSSAVFAVLLLCFTTFL